MHVHRLLSRLAILMLSSVQSPLGAPIDGGGFTATIPARSHPPRKTDSKVNIRTTFQTSARIQNRAPIHTVLPANPKSSEATLVTQATFDVTSFLPQPSKTGSRTSNNPTSTGNGSAPSSTSDSAIPSSQGSDNSSILLAILLSIFGALIVLLAIGSYIAWWLHKKRKAQRVVEAAQPSAAEADDNYHDEPPLRGGRRSVAMRLSEKFFAPSSRTTLDNTMSRTRRELNFPANVARQGGAPIHQVAERIRMRDLPPMESNEPPEPIDPAPSSPYVATSRVAKAYQPGPHQTTTTIGSLLNYYQESGKVVGTQGYERLSSNSHTVSQSAYETVYQDPSAERFGPADDTKTESVAGIIQPIAEPVLQARLEALARIEGRPLPNEIGHGVSRNGRLAVIPQDPVTPTDTYYGGLGENVSSWETAPPHNDSRSDFSMSDLRPSPLCIRKPGTSPLSSSPQENSPRMPEKRTGYEEYMDNPYRVGVSGEDNTGTTEEPATPHIQGSYELWAKQQREERMQRAAGYQVNRSDQGAINYTRGEGSGTQARSPLRQVAERTGANLSPAVFPQRQMYTQGNEFERHSDAWGEDVHCEETVMQSQGRLNRNTDRLEWYRVIRDRLRTQTPASSRQSQLDYRTEVPTVDIHKGKRVVGRERDDGYTYASTVVSEDVFLPRVEALRAWRIPPGSSDRTGPTPSSAGRQRPQPVTNEDIGTGAHQDTVAEPSSQRESRFGLRKKTSAGWKRLSGRFHRKEH